ncbi:hypothetical protein CMV_025130 [Castanea mollissima]|uniref:Cation-transporting P-type ATPase C-terminal domain-containing protein n=1 Tax=Castanea mollissima TaxID=60419 RepID=A0A8J4QM13_9ROSI|nr:hypothetical protein CMV_025130 [Castanea mollissima]
MLRLCEFLYLASDGGYNHVGQDIGCIRRFGILAGKDVLEDQNLCLMKDYKEIKDLPIQNDFAGDEICQKMTANDDLWETYIKVIGTCVGIATVGIFVLWYTQASFMGINLVSDGHTLVEFSQLRNWEKCSSWSNFTTSPFTVVGGHMISFTDPSDCFTVGKVKAMTLSLSVLVSIEMFNSLNALSKHNSLVKMPPWRNPWLLVAMSVSFGLHCLILYIPFLADVFGIVPLTLSEWILVILVSAPVILIDEVLKFVGRSQRWIAKEKMA